MSTAKDILDKMKNDSSYVDFKSDSILAELDKTKTYIEDFYNKKIDELNSFRPEFLDADGNPVVFNHDEVANKYEFLKMHYAEYDAKVPHNSKKSVESDFDKDLKAEEKRVENKQNSLKKMAENILKFKAALIETNKKEIEQAKALISTIAENKQTLKDEITAINTDITNLENEITNDKNELQAISDRKDDLQSQMEELNKYISDELIDKLNAKQDEIDDAKANGATQDEIDKLQAERDNLNNELSTKSNESYNLSNEIKALDASYQDKLNNVIKPKEDGLTNLKNEKTAKETDLANLPNEADYLATITEMETLNKDLENSLEEDIQKFNDKFGEFGIDFEKETEETNSEVADEKPEEKKDEKETKQKDAKGGNTVAGPAAINPEENALLDISARKHSNDIANAFMKASVEEQEKYLDYYGFEDLANNASHLGPFARAKLAKRLEEHLQGSVPNETDFLDAILSVSGKSIDFDAFFDKKGNLVPFNKLDIDTLRDIQAVINDFNMNKSKLSKDEIKYFDDNFMKFIKNGSLLQTVKTGRIKGFFEGFTAKSTVRNNISNAMTAYTRANANEAKQRESSSNTIRDRLGLGGKVNPPESVDNTKLDNRRRQRDENVR